MSFTCLNCGMTSHNPNDEMAGYCGNCHEWTGLPELPVDEWPEPKAEDRVWGDGFIDQRVVCQHTARNPLANGDEFCLNCGIVMDR